MGGEALIKRLVSDDGRIAAEIVARGDALMLISPEPVVNISGT